MAAVAGGSPDLDAAHPERNAPSAAQRTRRNPRRAAKSDDHPWGLWRARWVAAVRYVVVVARGRNLVEFTELRAAACVPCRGLRRSPRSHARPWRQPGLGTRTRRDTHVEPHLHERCGPLRSRALRRLRYKSRAIARHDGRRKLGE